MRWERHWRLHLDHLWLVRAEVEVHERSLAFVRIFLTRASGGRRASPLPEPGFAALRAKLERSGYELQHEDRLPTTLFLKCFRPTGPRLAKTCREVEHLSGMLRKRRTNRRVVGGILGAMHLLTHAPEWIPSSCGWSLRLRLKNRVGVVLAILLMHGVKGQGLHPEACVLLEAPESTNRRHLQRLTPLVRAAGYRGKLDRARPAGKEPFLFGHFWKARLGPGGAATERYRLDGLADALRLADLRRHGGGLVQ